MKKILAGLFVFILCASQAHATEGAVVLELTERNNLVVPDYNVESFKATNQDGEIITDDYDYSIKVHNDSQVFESKAGQAFEKFINQKVVDKKLNIFSTQIGRQTYNETQN